MAERSEEERAQRSYRIRGQSFAAPALEPGLYVVATPIGNLGDVTVRALDTLAGADLLACEDTRVTRRLLDRYGIEAKVTAYHEHSAPNAHQKILDALAAGRSVALVSDAGTPLVSDPGLRLVQEAIAEGIQVVPLPGAAALAAALAAAGSGRSSTRSPPRSRTMSFSPWTRRCGNWPHSIPPRQSSWNSATSPV